MGFLQRRRVRAHLKSGKPLATQRDVTTLLGAQAMLADAEVVALQRYAREMPGHVVEIGVAFGASTLLWLLNLPPSAHLTSIDPFIRMDDGAKPFQGSGDAVLTNLGRILTDVSKSSALTRWTLLCDYSHAIVRSWTVPIDLLFIDGDHAYASVQRDYTDWAPHVVSNGLILFHDSNRLEGVPDDQYAQGWPGPTQLVRELEQAGQLQVIDRVASLTVARKV